MTRKLRFLDSICAWGLVLLGSIHNFIAAPMIYPELSERALWFVGAGLALWYAGAINLVRRAAPDSRTARIASILTNVSLLAFVVTFGFLTGAAARADGMLLIAVVVAATAFSIVGFYPWREPPPVAGATAPQRR